MIRKIHLSFAKPHYISFVIGAFLFSCLMTTGFIQTARAGEVFKFNNFRPQKRSIKNRDLTLSANIDGDVAKAVIKIRRFGDVGDFTEIPMHKTEGNTYQGVVPLSEDTTFDWEPLEYKIHAESASGRTIETLNYHVFFIDAPPVDDIVVKQTAVLNQKEWDTLIKGPPIYKRPIFWVGAAAVVGIAAALMSGGGSKKSEPDLIVTVTIEPNQLHLGDTATIRITAQNVKGTIHWEKLELSGPQGCTFSFNPIPSFHSDTNPEVWKWDTAEFTGNRSISIAVTLATLTSTASGSTYSFTAAAKDDRKSASGSAFFTTIPN